MKKRHIKYIIKIIFTLGIFALILLGFQKTLGQQKNILLQIKTNFCSINYGYLLIATVMILISSLISSARLFILTRMHGIEINYIQLLKNLYVGFLFNPLLMGSTGGDIIRSYYLAKQTGKKTEIIALVFLDRFIGIYVMVLLCITALFFNFNEPRFRSILYGAFMIFSMLVCFTVVFFSERVMEQLSFLKKYLTHSKIRDILKRTLHTLHGTKKFKKNILLAALCTIFIQCLSIIASWIVSKSFINIPPVPLKYFFLFLPVIFTVSSIPILPGGVGVGEAGYAFLFAFVGVMGADAISISLLYRLITIFTAFIGGIVYLSPSFEKVHLDEIMEV